MPEENVLSAIYAEALASFMASGRKGSIITVRELMPQIRERYPYLLPSTIMERYVGSDQEKAQSERNSDSENRGGYSVTRTELKLCNYENVQTYNYRFK